MSIDVSIIIPLYNKEDWIIKTLESVENQTCVNWECLIIDDQSSDTSYSLVSDYIKQKGVRYRLISKDNSGQSATRNLGIANATGRYIAFLDADDLWASNKLEEQIKQLESDASAVCSLSAYQIFDSRKSLRYPKLIKHHSTKRLIRGWLTMRGFGGGIESGGLIRKSALQKVGGFNEQLSTSAGLDLTIRLSLNGKILFSNNTYFRYRKYLGQWHTFESVLVENLSLLRSSPLIQGCNLVRKHQAYVLLSRFRTSPRRAISSTSVSELFKLSPLLFNLTIAILFRNLRAVINGFLMAKSINKLFV
jgi:glycosyltransferase involved in cell wall biosynthesis